MCIKLYRARLNVWAVKPMKLCMYVIALVSTLFEGGEQGTSIWPFLLRLRGPFILELTRESWIVT